MRAGLLRHRVTIQARSVVRDAAGGEAETWVDQPPPVWARVRPLNGRELLSANQIQAETTHEVTMRYRPGLTSAHRLLFGTRILHIAAPPANVDERGIELVMLCKEAS